VKDDVVHYFRYGNFCGPNWSNGLQQESVVGGKPAIDALDRACKMHDGSYARIRDSTGLSNKQKNFARDRADARFYAKVKGLGKRGYVYGLLVKYGNRLFSI